MLTRYLLCLEAPPHVAERVRSLSAQLEPVTGRAHYSTAPPHITLVLVDMDSAYEHELTVAIARGVEKAHAFTLHIKGITHFKDQRTIYADPVEKEEVVGLLVPVVTMVKATANVHRYKIVVGDHPHLTIASGLKPAQFTAAWHALANAVFEATMHVGEVVLMARSLEPGSSYTTLQRFALA